MVSEQDMERIARLMLRGQDPQLVNGKWVATCAPDKTKSVSVFATSAVPDGQRLTQQQRQQRRQVNVTKPAATKRPTARKSVSVRTIAPNNQRSTEQRRVQQQGVAAMVQARGSRTMHAASVSASVPAGIAQQAPMRGPGAPMRGLTSANARQQGRTGAASSVKLSTRVQSMHAQVLSQPEARDAAEEIMAAKGWGALPADEQAMELLADRIDDILASKSRSRTARQRRHSKRSHHRYRDRQKHQEKH